MKATLVLVFLPAALCLQSVPMGFPASWDGDQYRQAECEIVQKPPSWVDGFLFAQTSASYGELSNPKGQKIAHLFDAISAVSVFDVSPKPTFTSSYYPTRAYKIWQFNDRDFKKSCVAWPTGFTDVNATAMELWQNIPTDIAADPPNVDFWKIGNNIVAGTESYQLGLTFDIPKIDNFRYYPFQNSDSYIGTTLIPIFMPMHEHVDSDTGLIWSVAVALNFTSKIPTFHQLVFTVDQNGVRTIQGIFDFAPVDISKCSPDGRYTGDVSGNGIYWPRYMHTVTATTNYLILPMTSLLFNPCQIFSQAPYIPDNSTVFLPSKDSTVWYPNAPVTFLLFDKKAKKFLEPIESNPAQFFSHQFNSYESDDGRVIVDILAYDEAVYDSLSVDGILGLADHPQSVYPNRYTIDLKNQSVTSRPILPANTSIEFSQINHKWEGKKYKYGYAVQDFFVQPSQILKIDMDTPSGDKNMHFRPSNTVSLGEPYFVSRPGAKDEDDGVVVVRGLDTSINKTRLYIVDAKSMTKVGEIIAPTYVPFGLHERFYLRESLGMKPSSDPSSGGQRSVMGICTLIAAYVVFAVAN